MSTSEPPEQQPSEEELRAAYEAEIKKIRVEHVLLENVVTLVNLGMRRTGISPGTEDERDPEQVRLSIDAIRSVLPLLEQVAPQQVSPIRDALSQLQMAYVKIGGGAQSEAGAQAPASEPSEPAPPSPAADPNAPQGGEAGPAQRSGRLWIPGQ